MNQVVEIPDSPDRLLATKHNKDRNKQPMPTKIAIICNGIRRVISIPTSCNNSSLFRKTKPTIDNARHDKGKALANTEVQRSTHKVNGHGQSEKGVLPLDTLPSIVSLDGSGKSSKVENIPKNGPTFDSGKGVDVLADNNTQPCTSTKVYTRRKKLVRNECVPLLNIEESKKVVVMCHNGSVMKEVTSGSGTVASDGGSSIVDIKDREAEDEDSRRRKGKGISCHFSSEEANAESSHLSQREHIHKDPAESSTDFDVEANGWRTTHNHWKQRDNKQQKNEIIESDHKNETDIKHVVDSVKTSSCMCYQPNEDKSGINTLTKSSTSRNRGKRPISYLEDSVGQPLTIASKRKQRDIKQQKIEIVQRNYINGIEIIDLDDSPISSPISSSRVRDIPDAEELGIDRQAESSTSRNRGKRPISCIEDSVGLSWATSRSKRSKNLSRPSTSNPVSQLKNLSGPSTSNPVSEPKNLSGPSTSNPVSEPKNLSGRSTSNPVSEPKNLGGLSTSNPVSEPKNVSGPSTSNPVSEPKNLGGPSTSNPVSEPKNVSWPSTSNPVSEPKNLSGSSTSNPVSDPNIQIHGNIQDLSVRALQIEEDAIIALQLQQQLYNEDLQRTAAAAEGDMLHNNLLQVNREFNENDYEMLLGLDEDNYRHQGATHAQINRLPVSTVQTEKSQECSICLESPTIGEKIRHLPCFHNFHKACVDEWLSRRTSCPVCKTSVDVTE